MRAIRKWEEDIRGKDRLENSRTENGSKPERGGMGGSEKGEWEEDWEEEGASGHPIIRWLWDNLCSLQPFKIFHETQKNALCGLHALNNLAQGAWWEEGELKRIAEELGRSSGFQHGNDSGWFSSEVLEVALRMKGWSMRSATAERSTEDDGELVGYIILDRIRQHWWTARKEGELVWAHDSMLSSPAPIRDLVSLALEIWNNRGTIFIVRKTGDPLKEEPGEQRNNQKWMTPEEFQMETDKDLAMRLHREELAKARRNDPPPYKGISPSLNKANEEGRREEGEGSGEGTKR